VEEEILSFKEFEIPTAEEWKHQAEEALKGASFEKKLIFQTDEGIPVQPIYTLEDSEKQCLSEQFPGIEAYERGFSPSGYIRKSWSFSQGARNANPPDMNRQILENLKNGQNCVHIDLNPSVLRWEDPESEETDGQKNTGFGLRIFRKEDVEVLLQDIQLNLVPLHIYTGENPACLIGLIAAAIGNSDVVSTISGIVGADPLSEWAVNGLSLGTIDWNLNTLVSTIRWSRQHASAIKNILVRGDFYYESGADSVLEGAIILALYAEYFRELLKRGVPDSEIVNTIACSIGIGPNFFMEIAKIRGLRVLIGQIQNAFGVPQSEQGCFFHGKVVLWDKTVYDPYVNLLRNTSEAFSAITAGVDSLEIPTYDTVYCPSDPFSERVSRNLHHILEKESKLTFPIDPAAGSWYIEALTEAFCKKTWSLFQEIESKGGITAALKTGWVQTAVRASRTKKDKNVRSRKRPFIGTTLYANRIEKQDDFSIPYESPESFADYRHHTEKYPFCSLSKNIHEQLQNGDPKAIEVLEDFFASGGTVGGLKRIFALDGRTTAVSVEIETIEPYRATEIFEKIRKITEDWQSNHGKPFPLRLFTYGSVGEYKARADFSEGFFDVAGFESVRIPAFRSVEEALNGIDSLTNIPVDAPSIFVLCSSDDLYPEFVPVIARKIGTSFPKSSVVLAGKPAPDKEQIYRESGINRWIYMGCDLIEFFTAIQNEVMQDA
jgi:methylmalonyl-CoA mutase